MRAEVFIDQPEGTLTGMPMSASETRGCCSANASDSDSPCSAEVREGTALWIGSSKRLICSSLCLLSVFNRIFGGSGASCLVFGTLRFGFWSLPLRFLGVNVCG